MGNTEIIHPALLAFDIDGVVADTMNLFVRIAREEYNIRVRYQDITKYMLEECLDIAPEIIEEIIVKLIDGSHDNALEPVSGAPEVLTRLARHGTVRFVTARPDPEPITAWMTRILSVSPSELDITATGSFDAKTGILLEKGVTWFVEDRLETCFPLKEAGIEPVLFRQPWNRAPHPFTEVGNWQELERLIAF